MTEMNRLWRSIRKVLESPWAAYTFALCSAVLFFIVLSNLKVLWSGLKAVYYFIEPVFIGLVIAYVLDPLVKFLETHIFRKIRRKSVSRGLSVLIVFVLIIFVVSVLLIALVPQLISSIRMFISNLGAYAKGLNDMLEQLNELAAQHDIDISNITSMGNDLIGNITSILPKSINGILDRTISYGVDIFNMIISCIIAGYLLVDKERILDGVNRLYRAVINEASYRKSNNFLGRCNAILIQYILCDLLDGLLIGSINAAFMLFAGYPYVPLISVVVGVTNLAPTFGPILGAVIGSAILVLINPWYALGFLIFTLILQTFDGYFFKPKLFGSLLGVPSILILAAIIVGGRMFGIIGILIAIPMAAIFAFLYTDAVLPRLEARRSRINAAEAAARSATDPGTDKTDHKRAEGRKAGS